MQYKIVSVIAIASIDIVLKIQKDLSTTTEAIAQKQFFLQTNDDDSTIT
jgi:hypothetical protein